jgi:hypothetical protein
MYTAELDGSRSEFPDSCDPLVPASLPRRRDRPFRRLIHGGERQL